MSKSSDPFAIAEEDAPAVVFHQVGCPVTRIERYTVTRAPRRGESARDVEVVRCIDCGVHHVEDPDA